MGGGRRLDARAGGTGDRLYVDIFLQQAGPRQRQQGQLQGRRKTAGVGHFPGRGNPVPVQFREPVHITVRFVPEILGQVYYLEPLRAGMRLPELPALAVSRTKEQHVYPFQVHLVRKHQVRVSHQAGVMLRHGFSRLALRMDPGDTGLRMVHQKPYQLTGRITGAAYDSRADHASPG